MMAQTWNFAPATSGHNAVKAKYLGTEPIQVRGAVNDLMSMFGASKQCAVSSTGTINADGTGTVTIIITAT